MKPGGRDQLYDLLPAIYRLRDATHGEPLRALLSVMQGELDALEADIGGLYDNWFIETCDDWVVPYIGDLLAARQLSGSWKGHFSPRAAVANTIAYRRRKGTTAMLEQLARDTTGWPARVAEYWNLLTWSQHLNHVRRDSQSTVDVRKSESLDALGGAFERSTHSVDVRRIDTGRGRYNVPNVGLFLWRMQAYAVSRATPRAMQIPADGRYRFSPLGLDLPLFNQPRTEGEITGLATEVNVPARLRRSALSRELEALRSAMVNDGAVTPQYFGSDPVVRLFVNGTAIPSHELMICNLAETLPSGDWRRPPTHLNYTRLADGTSFAMPISASLDPVNGRIAFPAGVLPDRVEVSYSYGFIGDIGGGPYDRSDSVAESSTIGAEQWTAVVTDIGSASAGLQFPTLADAVRAWNAEPPGLSGSITVLDSRSYIDNLSGTNAILIHAGSSLRLVAANRQLRPHLAGSIEVIVPATDVESGSLFISGLLIEGTVAVGEGNLALLQLEDCTLVPGAAGVTIHPSNHQLQIRLGRSICGPLLAAHSRQVNCTDSIIQGEVAILAAVAEVRVESCTVLGETRVQSLHASNSIFTAPVVTERRQTGCIRFSYVSPGSHTPRRYRCQPDLAGDGNSNLVFPDFSSTQYGQPEFAQLQPGETTHELRTGAEDGSEMGAFNMLKQAQREGNLRALLSEYLPVGLETGLFFVSDGEGR